MEDLQNKYPLFDQELGDKVLELHEEFKIQEDKRKTLEDECVTTVKYYDEVFDNMQSII
jgi:hypothetical protein